MGRLLDRFLERKQQEEESEKRRRAHDLRMDALATAFAAELGEDFQEMKFFPAVEVRGPSISLYKGNEEFIITIIDDGRYLVGRPGLTKSGPVEFRHSNQQNCTEAELFNQLIEWIERK